MIELKDYQERVLETLRRFLKLCSHTGAAEAFREATKDEDTGASIPYEHVNVAGLSDLPYVCLRVPTGGGKTLMACHAIGIAMDELLHSERSVVLWLVPSNTILDQTADALRDPRHPYRRALEMACGNVDVLTIEEALNLSRASVDGQTVVIVSTIQSFRVEDRTGRRVYSDNGSLQEHFVDVPPDRLADLDKRVDGSPIYSLANALKLRRPVVIVDEAHNARTQLSFAALAGVGPSCIVEFTATPSTTASNRSNVLDRAFASELKAAEMIKLPLRVIARSVGQKNQLLADAISLRADLESLARSEGQATGEYIRPILLIQAERLDACEPLRDRMVLDFNISRDQIVISTSRLDELKGIKDISDSQCPVRFIITVEKLREGWDCPFAYVLCSLKETRSATAIEQIVGRILRLPKATLKQHPELNCAYAFSVSDSIVDVLAELRQALESNGFTKAEAQRIILPVSQRLPLSVLPQTVRFADTEIDNTLAEATAIELTGKVQFDSATSEITVLVPLSAEDEDRLKTCAKTTGAKEKIAEAVEHVRVVDLAFGGGQPSYASPYMLNMEFFVPTLSIREEDLLLPFDNTILIEHEWRLSEKDASLPNYDPSEKPTGKAGQVDVTVKGELQASVSQTGPDFATQLHQQVFAYDVKADWSFEALVVWLARHIKNDEITFEETLEFIRKAVRGVISTFDVADIGALALDRFRLKNVLDDRIEEHRKAERKTAFQACLLSDSSLTVDMAQGVSFRTTEYAPGSLYEGGFQFQKHFYGPKPGELKDGEEGDCAKFIDGLREVKFWVRNLSKKPGSFRFQTSTDAFYPDFVCQLIDGRVLVVEYKGQHLFDTPDAEEKRLIGQAWESLSEGKCLFLMLTKKNFAAISAKIGAIPDADDFRLS